VLTRLEKTNGVFIRERLDSKKSSHEPRIGEENQLSCEEGSIEGILMWTQGPIVKRKLRWGGEKIGIILEREGCLAGAKEETAIRKWRNHCPVQAAWKLDGSGRIFG